MPRATTCKGRAAQDCRNNENCIYTKGNICRKASNRSRCPNGQHRKGSRCVSVAKKSSSSSHRTKRVRPRIVIPPKSELARQRSLERKLSRERHKISSLRRKNIIHMKRVFSEIRKRKQEQKHSSKKHSSKKHSTKKNKKYSSSPLEVEYLSSSGSTPKRRWFGFW